MLDGLWYGAGRPRRVLIFVHGLGGSAFSHHDYLVSVAGRKTAVLFFSNRGHDTVAGVKQLRPGWRKGYAYKTAGVAHEVFTECVDDLQGAVNFCLRQGAREIVLIGHSSGCQKIIYYLSRAGKPRRIHSAVLICPISDYAGARHQDETRRRRAEAAARALLRRRKRFELLPARVWPQPLDAQRFLSLYTPASPEEIFTYAQPGKTPRTLQKVKLPLLVVLAGRDEYADRPAASLAAWFQGHLRSRRFDIEIVFGARHGLKGKEAQVAAAVRRWLARRG